MNNYEEWVKYFDIPMKDRYLSRHDMSSVDTKKIIKFCEENPNEKVPTYGDYHELYLKQTIGDDDYWDDGSFEGWEYPEWLEHYCETNDEGNISKH